MQIYIHTTESIHLDKLFFMNKIEALLILKISIFTTLAIIEFNITENSLNTIKSKKKL